MLKNSWALILIIGLRFFGIFVVLPSIALYAATLVPSSDVYLKSLLIGSVVGGYALAQIIFQVPFGYLGYHFDRKKVIIFGLFIFLLGSIICIFASDIYWLVFGRFMQGAGAISGLCTAYLMDLVGESNRTKVMAFMGVGIFISLMLSMMIGPCLSAHYGEKSLFIFTAALNVLSIGVFSYFVKPLSHIRYDKKDGIRLRELLGQPNLKIMYISNFTQKALMTLAFTIIPLALANDFALASKNFVYVYSIAALFGFLALGFGSVVAEKHKRYRTVVCVGVLLFMASYIVMALSDTRLDSLYLFAFGVVLFFMGFCMLEPIMQSLTSAYSKPSSKGVSLSFVNTCGFLGSFIGSVLGAFLYYRVGLLALCVIVFVICVFWMLLISRLENVTNYGVLYVDIDERNKETSKGLIEGINALPGVVECYINASTCVIKYSKKQIDDLDLLERAEELIARG